MNSLKDFSIVAGILLAIAFAGIMYTGGEANVISYVSVAPLGIFVLILLVNGAIGFFKDNKPK